MVLAAEMVREEQASCPCASTPTQNAPARGRYADGRVLPPSREQLGRASWKLLHTAVAQFPHEPVSVSAIVTSAFTAGMDCLRP